MRFCKSARCRDMICAVSALTRKRRRSKSWRIGGEIVEFVECLYCGRKTPTSEGVGSTPTISAKLHLSVYALSRLTSLSPREANQ